MRCVAIFAIIFSVAILGKEYLTKVHQLLHSRSSRNSTLICNKQNVAFTEALMWQ